MPPFALPRIKACVSCAAAKAKCEPDAGYTKCKRCNRHGIDCVLKEPVPRKRRKVAEESRRIDSNGVSMGPCYSQPELARGIQYYHQFLVQYFPFVLLAEAPQLEEFINKQPFLSLVLAMLGCTQDRARQRALTAECKKYLGVHVLQNGGKTLDLLQGLLIMVYWYHFQFDLPTDNQRCIYLHMAMAMVIDLELNRSPLARNRIVKALPDAENGYDLQRDGPSDHSIEEMRTFLGCVYLTSVFSKCSMNMDALHFSDYVEKCCDQLMASPLGSDQDLVRLMRLQQLVERFEMDRGSFTQMRQAKGVTFEFNFNTFKSASRIDISSFVDYWSAELARYWDSVPQDAKTVLLRIQFDYARICLYEASLEGSLFPDVSKCIEVLSRLLKSLKSQLTLFIPLSTEPNRLFSVPSPLYAESNHAMFISIQLCQVQCEGWSSQVVEKELQLLGILERVNQSFENMLTSYPRNEIPQFFIRLAPVGRGLAKWLTANVRPEQEGDMAQVASQPPSSGDDEIDLDFLGQFLDLDDNLWLQSLLSSDDAPTQASVASQLT